MPRQTPSQTAGPYLHIGLIREDMPLNYVLTDNEITVSGFIFDGQENPIRDCVLESWSGTHFTRAAADFETGGYVLRTSMPKKRVDPFLDLQILARGLNHALYTRIYLGTLDETVKSAAGERANTLLALDRGNGQYEFHIHLQGERETVFFDL